MSEEYLVRNCAPTLAGLKTASLFTCPCQDPEALRETLRGLNKRLTPKGLRLLPPAVFGNESPDLPLPSRTAAL